MPLQHSYRDFLPDRRFPTIRPTLAVSPDGHQVAYADEDNGQYNLAVQSIVRGAVTRLTHYRDTTVRRVAWHPRGDTLIYAADAGGTENTQLYQVDRHGGEIVALTDAPEARHELAQGSPVSPDGRMLAYTANDRNVGDQDVLIRDLDTGEVRRVYTGGGRVYAGFWSPDSEHLTITLWRSGNSDHVVWVLPARGGEPRQVTSDEITATYWLGPWIPGTNRFLVASNAGQEFTGLATLDADTGALDWIDTPRWDIDEFTLSADGTTLVWTVNIHGASVLKTRYLTTGEEGTAPTLPLGQAQALSVSSDGTMAAMLLSTPNRCWNVAVADLTTGGVRWLTNAEPVGADRSTFVVPDLIHYPARDGTSIPAYLYRPAHTTGRRVGVVLSIHGGPVYQDRPIYARDGLYQWLLSEGVGILAPNMRGSEGYGKAYRERLDHDWGGVDLDDFADAHHWLRGQDWVDPHRIGLFGQSYGGFGVLSCLSRLPELGWAAGVDVCGMSNLLTLTQGTHASMRSMANDTIGDPDTEPDFLLSRSPVTYADHITAPLMVIQGRNDKRVPIHESDQIVRRLRDRGVEVRYVVFEGEGHNFSPESATKAYSDAGEFLIAHLAAVPHQEPEESVTPMHPAR
jgi:dipeptidyl aminopeptidase/acylaminoacyl peptidase